MATFAVLPLSAQDAQASFELGLAGGLGGALDADPGSGLDATTLQLRFAWITDLHTKLAIRAGTLDFGGDQLEVLTDADLQYVTIAGEYHFRDRFYDSALFLGLGYYELAGRDLAGASTSDSNVGLVLGSYGSFPLTRRLSFTLELSGHYAQVERVQLFLLGHAGLSFAF